jgi:hypothetical protein
MMAAGLLTIAYNSEGPKTGIVEHGETRSLATRADEYAEAIHQAFRDHVEKGAGVGNSIF